jgi:transposase
MKRLQDDRASARRVVKRRRYDAAFKRHLVELSLAPGASVARIALDHRLNANILFKWRRQQLRELAQAAPKAGAELLPVTVIEPQHAPLEAAAHTDNASAARKPRAVAAAAGMIEIDLPLGRVRLTGAVDLAALRAVIDALSPR